MAMRDQAFDDVEVPGYLGFGKSSLVMFQFIQPLECSE